LLELLTGVLMGPVSSSWVVRVISRGILAHSLHDQTFNQWIGPRKSLVPNAELFGPPCENPAAVGANFSIAAPYAMLVMASRDQITQVFLRLGANATDARPLVDHIVGFVIGVLPPWLTATIMAVEVRRLVDGI
jgi:hypothetical protein